MAKASVTQPYAREVVASVREILEACAAQEPVPEEDMRPPSGSPGWHAMIPLDSDGPTYKPYEPWSYLRLVDVVLADDLILILFGRKQSDDGSIYVYAENLRAYQTSAPTDIRFATVLIISHMDEFLGRGWEESTPSVRVGPLVILQKGAFAEITGSTCSPSP